MLKLSEEKKVLVEDQSREIQRMQATYDHELSTLQSQLHDSNQRVRDLEFTYDTKSEKLNSQEQKLSDFRIESNRYREDYNRLREKYLMVCREKENQQYAWG